jgi:hypothetical protein
MKSFQNTIVISMLIFAGLCRMMIRPHSKITKPPSKKFELDIPKDVSDVKIIRDENDPSEFNANNDYADTYDDMSINERTPEVESPEIISPEPEPEPEEESEEEEREPFVPKFFENFFPETDQDFGRDQHELRERIGILKSLENKYQGDRYVPVTLNELNDIILVFEELLDLRQMSQDFGRNHDDYLEQLRGGEEEVETEDGLTGELFEGLGDEEEEEEEEEEGNPWEETHEDHENENEHEDYDYEHEHDYEHEDEEEYDHWDHDEHYHDEHNEHDEWSEENHQNEHDLFLEHEAEKIAEAHKHDEEGEVITGHDIIADSEVLTNIMDKANDDHEEEKSPNFSELSYDSQEIKKAQNHETLNDEIVVIEGLEATFQHILMVVPDDKEYMNGITSEDHDQVNELFDIVYHYMDEYTKESEHIHSELDYLKKNMSLIPKSKQGVLAFFDLESEYSGIGHKLNAGNYTCQQKDKVINTKLIGFSKKIKTINEDLKNISSVLIAIENESEKIGNRINALLERGHGIEFIDKLDMASTFVPSLIDAKNMIGMKLNEAREVLMSMPKMKEQIQESVEEYDECSSGTPLD